MIHCAWAASSPLIILGDLVLSSCVIRVGTISMISARGESLSART